MKFAIAWGVLVALAAGGAAYGLAVHRKTLRAAEYLDKLNGLKREFLVASQGLPFVEEAMYSREVGSALAEYFSTLEELARVYPDSFDLERARRDVDAKVRAGSMDSVQKAQRDERIELTQRAFQTLRTGQYRPLYSAVDGAFRFDILSIERAEVGGQPRVKLSFAHWGAFGDIEYGSIEGQFQAPPAEAAEARAIPQLVAEDQGPSLQVSPERWLREFVPGVTLGFYDLPLLPASATELSLRFDLALTTSAGTKIPATLSFPKIPIDSSWKSGGDSDWHTQERFKTAKELQAAGAAQQSR